MTDQDTTNPVAEDELRPNALGVDADFGDATDNEGEGDDLLSPDADEDGEAGGADRFAAPDDDQDEFDLDGERLRLPKKVAPYLMRQADYTRKTQEVAETRRALAQQMVQQAEVEAAEASLTGRAHMLQQQLATFDQVDFDAIDPEEANRVWRSREQLREQLGHTVGQLNQTQQQRAAQAQHAYAAAVQDRDQTLAATIKGWSPELGGKLLDFARSDFGVSPQELAGQLDPRVIQVVHRAYSLDQEVKSLRRRLGLAEKQEIRPAPKASGNAVGAGSRDIGRLAQSSDFAAFEAAVDARRRKGR